MEGLSAVKEAAYSTGISAGQFFLYFVPFALIAAGLVILFFILKRKKVYQIEVTIDTVTDNNLVRSTDEGGVVKNLLGCEEFRLKRLKKSMRVPPRDLWILKNNGRFAIHFYRIGDDDFCPVNVRAEYKKVTFNPIKSESKQFLNMKAKEIIYKNKITRKLEEWKPVILWGTLVIGFIFLVIWYFKYAGELSARELRCITPEACKAVVAEFCQAAEPVKQAAQEGFLSPFKGGG